MDSSTKMSISTAQVAGAPNERQGLQNKSPKAEVDTKVEDTLNKKKLAK